MSNNNVDVNSQNIFILETLSKIYQFFYNNEEILKTIMSLLVEERKIDKLDIEYSSDILDFDLSTFIRENRIIPELNQRALDYYVENTPDLTQKQLDLIAAIKENGISSIFEIKSKNKQTFSLYCLTNEKEYINVFPPKKMIYYRHIVVGQCLDCMILKYENEYFLLDGFVVNNDRNEMLECASIRLTYNPWMLCQDNEQKCEQVNRFTDKIYTKFVEIFDKDTIITMQGSSDLIVDKFLNYINTDDDKFIENIKDLIELPKEYLYFDIREKEFENEEAFKKFCENMPKDNVGIFVDKQGGIYQVIGYGTFKKIFESSDYKSIEGYEYCIKDLVLEGEPDYPAVAVLKAYNETEDKENFLKIIKDVLKLPELQDMDLVEILKIYKNYNPDKKQISDEILPYISKTVQEDESKEEEDEEDESDLMSDDEIEDEDYDEDEEELVKPLKVGRNDPCPCGSGKKYKKCCLED